MFVIRIIIGLVSIAAAHAAIDPDNLCALISDIYKIAAEDNCGAYYTCNGGKATLVNCPDNLLFDKELQGCVPASQTTCMSDGSVSCEGLNGIFVAMPGSCSGYYYCEMGVAKPGFCPNGMNFKPSDGTCRDANEYGCIVGQPGNNANVACAHFPANVYFGTASNCSSYQVCRNNVIRSGSCGIWVFNVQSGACQYKGNYNCQQLNGNSTQTGSSGGGVCPATAQGDIKADPDLCTGYYVCSGSSWVRNTCPRGLFFNTVGQKCTGRQDAVNNCNRCEGTNWAFVNRYNDNCRGYNRCSNGKTTGNGLCPTGTYFNELSSSCSPINPEYPVCATASPPTPGPSPAPSPAPSTEPSTEPAPGPDPDTPAETAPKTPAALDSKNWIRNRVK